MQNIGFHFIQLFKSMEPGDLPRKNKIQSDIQPDDLARLQPKSNGLDDPSCFFERAHKLTINNNRFVQQKSNKLDDEYVVVGRLGSGVYGDVFKIRHKQLGLMRALKVIKKDPAKKYSQRNQIEVLKSLDHPNILKIYEFYELPNFYYIVTELFDGKELFHEILDCGIFSQGKAAETAFQILKALVYTHKRKAVHRDIKLENILIKSVNNVVTIKLIDWGFGSFVNNKLTRVCGTPQYAAPEIFQGEYDQKCDIWSFGILLYVLMSATFPFRGANREETISLIEKGTFTYHSQVWNEISTEAKQFINRLITKNPADRMSAQEAITSKWINKYLRQELNLVDLKDTLANFKQIHIRNNLVAAAVNFITNYLSTQQQKEKLNHVFNMLDTNGDGVLSFQEIAKGYETVYGPLVGHTVAEETFAKLDLNHNGVLEYNEFITYSLDLKKMMSGDKMKAAFKLFDANEDGRINLSEMKEMFAYDLTLFDEHKFKNWLDDLDSDGDGQVDEDEFVKSLINICNVVQMKKEPAQQLKPIEQNKKQQNSEKKEGERLIIEMKQKEVKVQVQVGSEGVIQIQKNTEIRIIEEKVEGKKTRSYQKKTSIASNVSSASKRSVTRASKGGLKQKQT